MEHNEMAEAILQLLQQTNPNIAINNVDFYIELRSWLEAIRDGVLIVEHGKKSKD